jgi:flagellar FliJ protein
MKKFQFSLESVLSYKDQVLDALQGEHALLLAKVREQEELIDQLQQQYHDYNEEYRTRKQEGMTVLDATSYQRYLRTLENEITHETQVLEERRHEAENKREEVVNAKMETSSLEKLKDKKFDAYQKAAQKSDELFVEEFVSGNRARASIGA